ncbi:Bromo adjacent homology domain-containing 1 protein [Anthophora quadrimaculata]
MKPQKKATVARKATKMPTIAKKRRSFLEKSISDIRKEKKSKKLEKVEDVKKKIEGEKKKSEKIEEKKKIEDKKKVEEKRKEKSEKVDEKKKYIKDHERKWEKIEEKKLDKMDEKITEEYTCDGTEKKKVQKIEEKAKLDKQVTENKKKIEKVEDKKKNSKVDDENVENHAKILNNGEENDSHEEKLDTFCFVAKKKCKDEKKKDTKLIKPDIKEGVKISVIKDKKSERKKLLEKGTINTKSSLTRTKKDSKTKSMQKKGISRKTVLVKKTHLSVVQKLVDKKIKLNKLIKDEEASVSEEDEAMKRTKRKNVNISKNKVMQEKKPKLGKHMKAKLPSKNNKISTALKKDDKLKTLVEKVVPKKKLDIKETEKSLNEHRKVIGKDESNEEVEKTDIKSELEEDKDIDKSCTEEQSQLKSQDIKKSVKSTPKIQKKIMKKKAVKVQMENIKQIFSSSEEVSSEESGKQIKVCEDSLNDTSSSKQEQIDMENTIDTNLKDEPISKDNTSSNAVSSESEDESGDETKRNKQKDIKKRENASSPSDERVRRMRLFGFWNGPKRHRVASLNALAKVHCLYENETGGVYLGGFCKPKPEKEKQKKTKEEKEEPVRKEKEKKVETKAEENVSKRKLRNVPGLRGKHWDMLESSSSSSSSDDDCEREKNTEHKKKIIKRRKKNEEVMDLKDMVVCKRMASLNATAILAASYSDEKNRCGSSSDSSSESEVEIIKKRKQNDSDIEKRKSRQNSEQDDVLKPSNKLVIVNQDTDVTITGVYVNQTRSTHHEGFCSIAGMQYRISSTSHTQTAATAVATELHDQQKLEQPCKSYTPLGALSSMQPPGTQGNHPNMSPRRHSAFSAPHQHGYYQPAGPLIQHPPTLPPIKGPPPEPTPTPPQNSEGSDDLVATSTTSGGTSSTGGGFYRAYCPQYYGTPPQYPDLCYPPTYSHPHTHPPPYYKYAPTYRRQYYGYQESGGGGGPGSGGTAGGPAVVDYQAPPPPPGDYPLPAYYGGYPPPPPPPPPPPNPAYLHSQGRPFVDHAAFQGCPCPMQSCPKNVDTGPLIGNGKGAPVVSGPGLSLPPSALVGPPSPARGLAGLAPPHGANAWDTDRVQLNTHRNLNQNQPSVPPSHNLVGGHNRPQNSDCKNKDEKDCTEDKLQKCRCQKHACTSTCEVKMETLSPTEKLAVTTCPSNKFHNFKLENNNVKCESCSVEMGDNLSCVANCNVKCESDYKCDIMKCEQCMKENQMAILEIDKDSGILLDEKLDADPDVKEELSDVVAIDNENWKKPDYEPTVQETIEETVETESIKKVETEQEYSKCQKVSKRKLSLDSLSDSRKKRKVSKRTLSVGSSQDLNNSNFTSKISIPIISIIKKIDSNGDECVLKKKQSKKDNQNQKRKVENSNISENTIKKSKTSKQSTSNNIPNAASDNSIMETINDVIQQSLQMTQKRDRKNKNVEKSEKTKQETNLLSAVKKVVKKVDQVKELTSLKLSKIIAKNGQSKNKTEIRTKSKTQEKNKHKGKGKSKTHDAKARDNKKQDSTIKSRAIEVQESAKKSALIKKKRKNVKKTPIKKSSSKVEDCSVGNENLILTRKTFLKPKWSNGWSWEGDPFEAKVYLTNEESAIRRCYVSMKHESGDVLRPRDCVLLKSGPRKADLPFVAKIAALWENPDDGEMMFSLLWYYRPEHTEQGRTQYDTEDEVFASRHRDANSVACIEDKCYILTFNEYCRYRKNLRRIEEGLESPGLIVPPGDQLYPRENRQPPIPVPSDMVLFCRRVYDYRGKKLVKNPG